MASAYDFGFVNSSWNCYYWDWEEALSRQRAYANLLTFLRGQPSPTLATPRQPSPPLVSLRGQPAARITHEPGSGGGTGVRQSGGGGRWDGMQSECSVWGSLYNQVHVSWDHTLLSAIFYVNDTHTARKLPFVLVRQGKLTKQQWTDVMRQLQRSALDVAARAYGLARRAQAIVQAEYNVTLPIVQYVYTDECYNTASLDSRLSARAAGQTAAALKASAEAIFQLPPRSHA